MRPLAAFIMLSLASLAFGLARPAAACDVPPLAGVWENPHATATQDVTRLEIAHVCQTRASGGMSLLHGKTWTVRAFSKCAPRDCKWGREAGEVDAEGRLVVMFATFSARRTVYIRHAGHAVYVDVEVDYHNGKAKDRKESLVLVSAN